MLEISDDINEVIKSIENMTLKVESSMKSIELNMKNSFSSIADSMNQTNGLFEQFSFNLDSSSKSQTVFDNTIAIASIALSALAVVVGVAADSQFKLNLAVMANPYVIAAASIVALAGVIGGLVGSMSEENTKHQETMDAINKEIEARNNLRSKQQEQLDANLSEITNVQALNAELSTLVDANGQIKAGYEERAAFIVGVLNKALGEQISIENNVLTGYNNSAESIENKIAKMKAEAILEAQLPAYKKALLEATDAQIKADKLEMDISDLKTQKKAKEAELQKKYGDDWIIEAARRGDGLLNEWANLGIDTKKKEEEYKKQDEIVKGYYDDIANYETNAALIASGNAENYAKVQMDSVTAKADSIEEKKAKLQEEIDAETEQLEYLRSLRASETDAEKQRQLDAQIEALDKRTLDDQTEVENLTAKINKITELKQLDNAQELELLGGFINEKQAKLAEMYLTDESKWTESQKKEAEALKNSINSNLGTYNQFAIDKVASAIDLSSKLNDNSTQQEKDAAAAAIKEAESTLAILSNNALDKISVLEDLKARRAMNDKSVTDEMIKEASRQAFEAKVGYGEVAKKIKGSWEDLPESSRKTFENVMTPMMEEMEKSEPSLLYKAASIADGILANLRKSFDIHSPSRKVREIFRSVMEGAELGLDDGTSNLYTQTEDISNHIMRVFTNVETSDLQGFVKKMQSAIDLENLHMRGIVNSNFTSELFSSGKLKVELPKISGTIHGSIENHILMDGRETAVQLTPFISEELAFSSK